MNTPNSSHTSSSKYAVLLVSSFFVMYAVVGGLIGLVDARAQVPQSKNGALPQIDYFSEVLARVRNDYVGGEFVRFSYGIDAIGCFAAHAYVVQALKYCSDAQSNQCLIICQQYSKAHLFTTAKIGR